MDFAVQRTISDQIEKSSSPLLVIVIELSLSKSPGKKAMTEVDSKVKNYQNNQIII